MLKIDGVPQISSKNQRIIDVCLRLASTGECRLLIPKTAESAERGARLLNNAISSQEWEKKQKVSYVKALLGRAKGELIPLEELSWFRGEERACYWVYGNIIMLHGKLLNGGNQMLPIASALDITSSATATGERFNQVVQYLDRLDSTLTEKRHLLETIKQAWIDIQKGRMPFTWLNKKDEAQCRWAMDYMGSYGEKQGLTDRPKIEEFPKINQNELYLAIYAAYDLWLTSKESKALFRMSFNKAWNQKQHRDNRVGKKIITAYVDENVRSKLDAMASQEKKNITEFLESLIESEFVRRQFNGEE